MSTASKAERVYACIGLAVGCAGFALIALAQLAWAYAAIVLLALVALAAGLATAKWLPRALYGQQLITGVRAGALACGIASLGLLMGLAVGSHASVEALARRSHLLGVQLASAATALHLLGWLGVALVFALLGSAIGTGLAGVVAQVAAWDKNQHAIQVIERAREAAQRSAGRTTLGGPYSGQARRSTGALPLLPHYPPLGQQLPDGEQPWSVPTPGASEQDVLHDALAAWAEGANRGGAPGSSGQRGREGEPGAEQATDGDNWLC